MGFKKTKINELFSQQAEVLVYQFQGNEYRLTPFKLWRTNFCKAIADDFYVWPDFSSQSEIPAKCPVLKVLC